MKAIVCTKYGSPEFLQLQEVVKPLPKENEVLIRVHATTVTSGDTVLRQLSFIQFLLMWPIARLFFGVKNLRKKVLGHEFAGEVEAIGKTVKQFKIGDQVFGTTGFEGGAHAEYVCVPEDGVLALKPTNMIYEEAAATPIGANCALNFLRKGNIRSGQNVLIYGASGSIGTFAVQLAKYFGAEVTGVCSTSKLELVKSLGADRAIDYTTTDYAHCGDSFDLIFDTVGKISSSQSKRVMTKKGCFISTHGAPIKDKKEDLIFIKGLIEEGQLKAVIDRCYPLNQAVEAHRYVDLGHKKGNVVIQLLSDKFL